MLGLRESTKKQRKGSTHNDLDDLRRRVQVDVPLVDLHLVTVPGLRTFTTRLHKHCKRPSISGLRNERCVLFYGW